MNEPGRGTLVNKPTEEWWARAAWWLERMEAAAAQAEAERAENA